jgi:hypothetical protein
MPESKVKIELTESETKLFINLFRRYQDIWEKTKELKPGCLVLHFDSQNYIKKHEFHFYNQTKL